MQSIVCKKLHVKKALCATKDSCVFTRESGHTFTLGQITSFDIETHHVAAVNILYLQMKLMQVLSHEDRLFVCEEKFIFKIANIRSCGM